MKTYTTTPVTVRTLEVVFEGVRLTQEHNTAWVANELSKAKANTDLILNHTPNGGVIHRYPKIQCRKQYGRAVVWAMNEGVEVLKAILDEDRLPVDFLLSQEATPNEMQIAITEDFQKYTLRNWAALNEENLLKWNAARSLSQKAVLLENILTNHLIEFCKAVEYFIPEQRLEVHILDYRFEGTQTYPNQKHLLPLNTFTVLYECNLMLPQGIGLGKGKRKGFGIQKSTPHHQNLPERRRKNHNNQFHI